MKTLNLCVIICVSAALMAGCSREDATPNQYGSDIKLPAPERGLLPNMTIAKPAAWGDRLPTVPKGYTITAIATNLNIPRQTLVLPNGDIGGGARWQCSPVKTQRCDCWIHQS